MEGVRLKHGDPKAFLTHSGSSLERGCWGSLSEQFEHKLSSFPHGVILTALFSNAFDLYDRTRCPVFRCPLSEA